MAQEIGETRNAMIEDDERIIQQILDANKHRRDKYWIVLFAKKAPVSIDGKPTLSKFLKPYFKKKPKSMVGLIIGEVDNEKGTLEWEVNHHDVPIDFGQIGLTDVTPMAIKSKIGSQYIYNS
jgi:hypothetical protein